MTRVEELLTLHESTRTARASGNGSWNKTLAAIEDELYQLAPMRKQMGVVNLKNWRRIERWIAEQVGISCGLLQCRRQLFTYKNTPDDLWEQVDAGFSLYSAVKQMRRSRRSGEDTLPLQTQDEGTRTFWVEIRSAVRAFIVRKLPAVTADEAEDALDAFEKDLLVLCAQHQKKWIRAQQQQQQTILISRTRFCNALHTLHMDSPKRGVPLAATLVQANRQKRTLARLYHPDTNKGDGAKQFQAVIDAYLTVEQYVRENTIPNSPLRLHIVKGEKTG